VAAESSLELMDARALVSSLFGRPRALIGMIHVGALPGSPGHVHELSELVHGALAEARILEDAGFHGLMIENMHDRPYLKRVARPETVASMTAIGLEVRRATALPLGVQVLAGANREALAVALAIGAQFIRAEGFVFGHVADEGWIEADAGELLRYRRAIGAGHVRVFADVKKKHAAHAATADVGLVETARAAEFFLADGVIVTGGATGLAADQDEVEAVSRAVTIPTLVGSGVTPDNVTRYSSADGLIVGSSIKRGGVWSNPIDPGRTTAMVEAFTRAAEVAR
jgi:membrane complex biogenesis BtpA family protein